MKEAKSQPSPAASAITSPSPSTGLVQDERFEQHHTGSGHPERPQRLVAIREALEAKGLTAQCTSIPATSVDMQFVRTIHTDAYLERLENACKSGRPYIDVPDSGICTVSYEIAQLAAGAVLNAVDAVMAGQVRNAFCAVRPPGHHAERHMSMGFCLLNNVALAAQYLLDRHGLERVLILDWDVHHGNGTQHIFEEDPRVLFISLHGHPGIVYPGTGYAHERGRGRGEGFTINIPILPPGREEVWREAFEETIHPAVEAFAPQFVLVSAGFDAHRLDPLAPLELETESYGWLTGEVLGMARRHCDGKLVSLLEGGYHLGALSESVALHVAGLFRA